MKNIKYNGELKVINTPEKAYLLGLIYSDGYIGYHNGSYIVSIVLNSEDLYLLEILREEFPFFSITERNNYCSLNCYQKDCVKDLMDNGVYFRKSTETKELLSFPNIDNSLQSHFIRGYFDGDGSVFKQKVGNTKIEIGGTGFKMITDIIKVLYDNRITVNLRCKYAGEALRKHDFYVLYTSSDTISKQFANFIYKDCKELYLRRKYEKLYFIPEYNRKSRLVCPICGGANTTYNGIRYMKNHAMQRGTCKDCKKQFSINITAPQSSNILSGEGELLEA